MHTAFRASYFPFWQQNNESYKDRRLSACQANKKTECLENGKFKILPQGKIVYKLCKNCIYLHIDILYCRGKSYIRENAE